MKKAIKISVFLVLLLFIILGGVFVQGKTVEANVPEQQKYYTTVRLQEGESLWTLAQRYCGYNQDIRQYVQEIQNMNHIVNERALPAGSYITVYYWDEVGK